MVPPGGSTPDFVDVSKALTVLGSPVRLEILRQLRLPKTLAELRVRPHRADAKANPDRIVARQTVQGHLDRLVSEGLVHAETVDQGGRDVTMYRTDASRLYVLLDELREVCTLYSGPGTGPDQTGTLQGAPAVDEVTGPRLVLVHGVYEGKAYPLDKKTADADGWVVGRAADAAVGLDYDPYVSSAHSRIVRKRGKWFLVDLGSKNGTTRNWAPLAPNETVQLAPGDVIGVGRSRLTFIPG